MVLYLTELAGETVAFEFVSLACTGRLLQIFGAVTLKVLLPYILILRFFIQKFFPHSNQGTMMIGEEGQDFTNFQEPVRHLKQEN